MTIKLPTGVITRLDVFCEAMAECAQGDDVEREHSDADDLLEAALQIIAESLDKEARKKIERLLDLYGDVEKWYS